MPDINGILNLIRQLGMRGGGNMRQPAPNEDWSALEGVNPDAVAREQGKNADFLLRQKLDEVANSPAQQRLNAATEKQQHDQFYGGDLRTADQQAADLAEKIATSNSIPEAFKTSEAYKDISKFFGGGNDKKAPELPVPAKASVVPPAEIDPEAWKLLVSSMAADKRSHDQANQMGVVTGSGPEGSTQTNNDPALAGALGLSDVNPDALTRERAKNDEFKARQAAEADRIGSPPADPADAVAGMGNSQPAGNAQPQQWAAGGRGELEDLMAMFGKGQQHKAGFADALAVILTGIGSAAGHTDPMAPIKMAQYLQKQGSGGGLSDAEGRIVAARLSQLARERSARMQSDAHLGAASQGNVVKMHEGEANRGNAVKIQEMRQANAPDKSLQEAKFETGPMDSQIRELNILKSRLLQQQRNAASLYDQKKYQSDIDAIDQQINGISTNRAASVAKYNPNLLDAQSRDLLKQVQGDNR